ncbi:DinB family protein [Paenibacillus sp. N3.4]|uniref:DinB family protein n=1 Tax=Paenibacillus sp. N3.4 TaxID=2603222 RepID=UPI0011C88A2D|nr:DinB family protein [Paenibacillus sp. N3.4]TXK79836.1 DinB family protein [Paenibacillus sp. N3.4]
MSKSVIDLQKFTNTYEQLRSAIAGLSEEELHWKASESKWSVVEVLSHLADHSIITSFRIRKIVAELDVQIPAFDQDPWVSHSKANESSAEEVLAVYQALLTYNTLFFKRLSAEDWEKSGVNVQGKTLTISDLYHSFVDHVGVHLSQIDRIKQAYK